MSSLYNTVFNHLATALIPSETLSRSQQQEQQKMYAVAQKVAGRLEQSEPLSQLAKQKTECAKTIVNAFTTKISQAETSSPIPFSWYDKVLINAQASLISQSINKLCKSEKPSTQKDCFKYVEWGTGKLKKSLAHKGITNPELHSQYIPELWHACSHLPEEP